MREDCPNKARCGNTGHYAEAGVWKRCNCLVQEMNRKKLGPMYDPEPTESQLTKRTGENLVLEGSLQTLRPLVAHALLDMAAKGKTWLTMDAYRLIEIFLEKDEEIETTAAAIDPDLLIILLGFGDPKNKYLPDLLMQALSRRELQFRPTWVVMGLELDLVQARYGSILSDKLKSFKKARVQ